MLTHPDILGHKLDFSRRLIMALKDTAWFGALEDFGDWWPKRDEVELDVERRECDLVLTVSSARPVSGISVEVPKSWALHETGAGHASQLGHVIQLNLNGPVELVFRTAKAS